MSINYQKIGKKLVKVVVAVSAAFASRTAVGEGFKAAADAMKNV